MSILDALREDHDKVKGLLGEASESEDAGERGELIKQIRAELVAHSKAEEKVLYRQMQKSEEGKDEALEGAVEHELAEQLADQLVRSRSKGSDEWKARCSVLKEMVETHIEEEEGEFFDTARELFDGEKLDQMEEQFQAEKARLGVKAAE